MCRLELLGCLVLLAHDVQDQLKAKPAPQAVAMLHEILLALSGHSSPLLRPETLPPLPATANGHAPAPTGGLDGLRASLTPPERALLADLARLSDLHSRLRTQAVRIAAEHPSVVCRAVGAAIVSIHLAAFQKHVLDVEATVLRRDPALVGAYDIVPLTAIVSAFSDWPRRFEWLWATVHFILPDSQTSDTGRNTEKALKAAAAASPRPPTSAQLIDHLRNELQTGYEDIGRTAWSLVRVAETAWLKQVSAWILYGRLPSAAVAGGGDDFFVQQLPSTADQTGEYICLSRNLPSFVSPSTAASMLFIGRSLVHIRAQADSALSHSSAGVGGSQQKADRWMSEKLPTAADHHLSAQLQELAKLTYPLDSATFARTIAHIRAVLSRTALRKLLPPFKVVEMLQLLRNFYLLGRGEFTMALVEQADETLRSRWQRSDGAGLIGAAGMLPPAPTTASSMRNMQEIMVKDGEVAAMLARTWAMLGSMNGRHANDDQEEEEDVELELARDTLRLVIDKPASSAPVSSSKSKLSMVTTTPSSSSATMSASVATTNSAAISSTPFRSLLLSVPTVLTMQIPYPLDLVLSLADMQAYAAIHAYLLSIRRAHIRLTGLWKLSSLRRHHPPPPPPPYSSLGTGGRSAGRSVGQYTLDHVRMLRERYTERADALRSVWATTSAAIFFLAEMESYLQIDVVVELWDGFQRWLTTGRDTGHSQQHNDRKQQEGISSECDDAGKGVEGEEGDGGEEENDDIWLTQADVTGDNTAFLSSPSASTSPSHDPQSLATAHRRYLRRLVQCLLLNRTTWTEPLYALLVSVDQLAALVQRLQALWQALDLESDAGVVDAFVDLEQEQEDVLDALAAAEQGVRRGVVAVVEVLREMEREDGRHDEDEDGDGGDAGDEGELSAFGEGDWDLAGLGSRAAGRYMPRRAGGLDRLLMKLDFGSWGAGG